MTLHGGGASSNQVRPQEQRLRFPEDEDLLLPDSVLFQCLQ